jgi:hypothetical protein
VCQEESKASFVQNERRQLFIQTLFVTTAAWIATYKLIGVSCSFDAKRH